MRKGFTRKPKPDEPGKHGKNYITRAVFSSSDEDRNKNQAAHRGCVSNFCGLPAADSFRNARITFHTRCIGHATGGPLTAFLQVSAAALLLESPQLCQS